MRSLVYKLTLAFLLVGLVGVGLVALLVAANTKREFHSFVDAQLREELVARWAQYYVLHGSWEGTTEALPAVMPYPAPASNTSGVATGGPPPGPSNRDSLRYPLIVDTQGVAVISAGGYAVGQAVPSGVVQQGLSIQVDGATVGTLIVMDRSWPESVPRSLFLSRFTQVLYWGAGGAILLALALGVLFSRSLTRSLRELTRAAEAMSTGKLGHSIPVRSNDEVGELTRAFNQLSSDLARAQGLRRQMTADIAHELRTPLSLVLGHAEALRDGVIPASQENFGIIHEESLRLSRLVDDLRTLSLSDAGELALDRQPVSPNDLLRQAAAAFGEPARVGQITLSVEAGSDLPEVDVDAYRIAQVLGNLMSNALRYTPAGGEIALSAHAEPGAPGSSPATTRACDGARPEPGALSCRPTLVRFAVRDSGQGISPEDLPYIFERFYRSDKSRRRPSAQPGDTHGAGDSTGLGLAIARSIVEAHGGALEVQSAPGEGATFTFTLPTADSAPAPSSI